MTASSKANFPIIYSKAQFIHAAFSQLYWGRTCSRSGGAASIVLMWHQAQPNLGLRPSLAPPNLNTSFHSSTGNEVDS